MQKEWRRRAEKAYELLNPCRVCPRECGAERTGNARGGFSLARGLRTPIVYNTGGYDRVETLKLLDGMVDIYMPDIKYSDNEMGWRYSNVPGYWDVAQRAIKEMHRQVGDLVVGENGIAQRGLLIRHLVLPNGLAGTEKVTQFLAEEISKDTYVNIMDQYHPTNKAFNYPELSRRITKEEFEEAVKIARNAGLYCFNHTL